MKAPSSQFWFVLLQLKKMRDVDIKNSFFSSKIWDLTWRLRTYFRWTQPAKCWECGKTGMRELIPGHLCRSCFGTHTTQQIKIQRAEVLTAELVFLSFLWMLPSLCFFHSWGCITWHGIKSLNENFYSVQPGEVVTLFITLFAPHSLILALWEKVPLCPSLFTGHQNKSDNIDSFK